MDHIKKEKISSIFLFLFSIFICFFSYKLSLGSIHSPDAGFFPFYLGIILGLLSLNNFIKAFAQRKAPTETIKTSYSNINWSNIIITVVILFAYPLMLHILGFPLSTFLFTALFLRFINPQRWVVVLGTGGAVAIIFYLFFSLWLKIQFPSGIFGI
jgi:hypothetical protein